MSNDINLLDRKIAQAIISSLSSGTVSIRYSCYYDVGRQSQIETVKKEIKNNSSRLRFINGDYGTGKTHFLSTISHWAIQNNYAPSHVILSPRGTPLYDLEAVYSRIIKNLVIDDQEVSSPIEAVLEFVFKVFQGWVLKYIEKERQKCIKTGIDPLYCQHCNLNGNVEKMYIKNFRQLDTNLQIAIYIYRYARWGQHPDYETADMVIRWIEGEPLYRRELNYLGLWDNIGRGDILKGVNEIAKLISFVNKKGIIIMLDEAEGIENLTPYQKPIAYENLQTLIEGAKKVGNLYFLYATTPTFYNDAESCSNDISNHIKNTACIDLAPLTYNDKIKLAKKITDIYIRSLDKSGNSIDKKHLKAKAVEYIGNVSAERLSSVRNLITGLIDVLKS